MHHAEKSPLQIGNKGSTQFTNFSDSQIKEIEKIITEIEKTIQDKTNAITPEDRLNVESDVKDLRQELSKPERDQNTKLGKIGLLYKRSIKKQTLRRKRKRMEKKKSCKKNGGGGSGGGTGDNGGGTGDGGPIGDGNG